MPLCSKCGEIVNSNFCSKCGRPVLAGPGGAKAASTQPAISQANAGMAENVAGALCYAAGLITGIIFLALPAYNRNAVIRFHAFQSILFHVAWMALLIGEMIIGFILPLSVSLLVSLLSLLVWGGGFLLWFYLIWKAYSGQRIVLPIIGALAEKQASQYGEPVQIEDCSVKEFR